MTILATEVEIWGMPMGPKTTAHILLGFFVVGIQLLLILRGLFKKWNKEESLVLSMSLGLFLIVIGTQLIYLNELKEISVQIDSMAFALEVLTLNILNGPIIFITIMSAIGPILVILKKLIHQVALRYLDRPDS
jgi:hypothetical protein